MNAAAPRRPLPGRTTLIIELTAAWTLAVAMTVIWAVASRGYFWPMWVYLAIAIVLSVHLGVVWAWAQPEGRRRQLAIHGVLTAILVAIEVAVWAMSGGGLFWPIFPLVALGGLFAIHAAVRWPQARELEVRVQELTRTRRGALDVQGAELRRIERDLHDGAQARLVALSIQLGRAEERLEDQPETAELVRRARQEATAAIGELRDLARGIAPPVLADRGLAAAVQALADRSAPDVTVNALVPARLPSGGRDRRLLRRRRIDHQRRQARPGRGRTDHDRRVRRQAGRLDQRRRPGRRRPPRRRADRLATARRGARRPPRQSRVPSAAGTTIRADLPCGE